MRPDSVGTVKGAVAAPIQAASARTRSSVAFAKSALSTHNDRYIELDDFAAPTSPVASGNQRTVPLKRRRKLYIPQTLWTRAFAITGIIETVITVGIER